PVIGPLPAYASPAYPSVIAERYDTGDVRYEQQWAPRGQTPILEFNFNWKSLSAVAGLTFLSFYFRLYAGAVKSPQVIDFLQALMPAHSQAAAFGLGPLAGPPQPSRARLYRPVRRQSPCRVSSRLRPRTKSGGIHLGLLEATRTS